MRHNTIIILLTIMVSLHGYAQTTGTEQQSTICIPDTDDEKNLGAHIRHAFSKWKVPVQIVDEEHQEQAQYILSTDATHRNRKWHEGWLTYRGEFSSGIVTLRDQCGGIAWSEAAGDRSMRIETLVGPFAKKGPRKVADRIARRFKNALKEGTVAKPCNESLEGEQP